MSRMYLMLYNLAAALGWGYLLYTIANGMQSGATGKELWSTMGTALIFVQTSAALEILHSVLGLVRSPVVPTILQVGSRLFVLWFYMVPSNGANGHWSLYLCVASWALVEIPRYLFYFAAVASPGKPVNSLLFFLRYNLFIVLYPSGISGELFQMFHAYGGLSSETLFRRFVTFHFLLYVPLGPFMIFNMWINRKKAGKKRSRALNPRPLNGLIWPVTNKDTNERSTSKTNKAIWVASVNGVDKNIGSKCKRERNWRFGYTKHVLNNVVLSCQSRKNALEIANTGLNKAYEMFEFMRDGQVMSFGKAMRKGVITNEKYDTYVIQGNVEKPKNLAVEIPYGECGKYKGKPYYLGKNDKSILKGTELNKQLKEWVEYGTIEESAADAISMVNLKRDEYLDLSNHYFVLLGATSAMGPLYFLLKHGANIIAVDLNRDFIWKKLFAAVRNSPGRLIFPIKKGTKNVDKMDDAELAKISGCDLLSDTPEIANWLTNDKDIAKYTKNKGLMIGNYTYLDGALHVQLSLACDSIINRLCKERKDTMIAFLCTPTDDHIITKEAYNGAKESFKKHVPTWASLLNTISCGKLLGTPNYKAMRVVNDRLHIIDGIVNAQGPNYALAKRLQHWRAIIAHSNGHVVSTNVAPSTATESVVHNAQFAAAYGGMHLFKPMEVMYQRTSLAVMGTLLIHDIRNPESAANPKSKIAKKFSNPLELMSYYSFHGGVWRCSYKIDTIGVPSAIAFYVKQYTVPIIGSVVGLIATGSWLATGKFVPL